MSYFEQSLTVGNSSSMELGALYVSNWILKKETVKNGSKNECTTR